MDQGWDDGRMRTRIIMVLALVAALITILGFATGIFSIPQFLGRSVTRHTATEPTSATAVTSPSDVTFGTHHLTDDKMFSFSTAKSTSTGGDIAFKGPKLYAPGGILSLGAQSLNSIKRVPAIEVGFFSRNYDTWAKTILGNCYAIWCADRKHFAVVRVTNITRTGILYYDTSFEWRYQANGSDLFP